MSTSTPTADRRRPWVVRSPVGRIYTAALRISCGLIPNNTTQQSQPGRTGEAVEMERVQTVAVPATPVNLPVVLDQEQGDTESAPNPTTQESVTMEGAPVPAPINTEDAANTAETLPAVMEEWLVYIDALPEVVAQPEPAIEVILPQPPPPPPPPPPPTVPPEPRMPLCIVCQETRETEESKFPYNCKRCYASEICMECLKDWFLDACKNESKMPVKCGCSPIPVTCMNKVLSSEQIKLYRAKYEESQTPDRLYCPVPTCSTFIPPRLFVTPKSITEEIVKFQLPQIAKLDGQTPQEPSFVLSMSLPGPPAKRPSVSCPGCDSSICTKCRALEHVGECSDDLDPELAEMLKKWRIKRCPKCRTGVRKVYGCSHVECRCGAHFCWQCLKPYSQCDQTCSDEDDDDESIEEDDLDGQAGFYEGDEHDFGDEPDNGILEAWACDHHFTIMETPDPTSSSTAEFDEELLQCSNCYRAVSIVVPNNEDKKDTDGDTQIPDADTPPVTTVNPMVWRCHGAHIDCAGCLKDPPSTRVLDPTRQYTCDCGGKVCAECDTPEVATKWLDIVAERQKKLETEAGIAWRCSCGSIVCGSCKAFMDE